MTIRYKVNICRTEEGVSVWVPGLPGCWSQGQTEIDALENIKDAIGSYLETVEELTKGKESPKSKPRRCVYNDWYYKRRRTYFVGI